MNYLTYPFKVLNITQNYYGVYSHIVNTTGFPKDYPIDDNGGTTSQDSYFYCPCDSMTIKRIYGVGTSGTNTIWLESNEKVKTPSFEDYVTILLMHPEDKDLINLEVSQTFKRGDKVTLEGKDGNATGYHFHMSVGRGLFKDRGWVRNTTGGWVIVTTEGGVKPEEAFYIDKKFTTVKNTKDITFKTLPSEEIIESNYGYVTAFSLNVRKGPSTTYTKFNTLPKNTKVEILEEKDSWYKIGIDQWISGEYVTKEKPNEYYETKEVTASWLNVRKTPNGDKLTTNAPIPKYTKVAVMEVDGYWTKINTNRWVYSYYLKSN